MRLLVVSDSHGDGFSLRRAIDAQPTARAVFHLGDGVREAGEMEKLYPDRTFYMVRGNCDFAAGSLYPEVGMTELEGRRIVYLHGYTHRVKSGMEAVIGLARQRQADILLFGHTHRALSTYEDGLYILNPGSVARSGTYGVVDITPAGIVTSLRENDR